MKERQQAERGIRTPSATANRARRIFSGNVGWLLSHRYPIERHKTQRAQYEALGKDAGVSPTTVQRAIDPENGVTLDIMADLAAAFELKLGELLSPELIQMLRAQAAQADNDEKEP